MLSRPRGEVFALWRVDFDGGVGDRLARVEQDLMRYGRGNLDDISRMNGTLRPIPDRSAANLAGPCVLSIHDFTAVSQRSGALANEDHVVLVQVDFHFAI